MIKRVQDPAGGYWQSISVQHVASRRQTGSLGRSYISPARESSHIEDTQTTLVSCKADRMLVPGWLEDVGLHELPSLRRLAQLNGPVVDGLAARYLRMDWAAGGSLATIAWYASWRGIAVTVHCSCDGSLQHTLQLHLYDPHSIVHPACSIHAFAACPHQPAAAVAYKCGLLVRVILMNLATGTHTFLRRPHHNDRHRYGTPDSRTFEFVWPSQGQRLAVQEATLIPKHELDWSIFGVPCGAWCGTLPTSGDVEDLLVWSLKGNLCLSGHQSHATDLSVDPPNELRNFFRHADGEPAKRPDGHLAFVPGTRHMVEVCKAYFLRTSISHWVYNDETQSSSRHVLPQSSGCCFDARSIAWHPMLRGAAIYAVVDVSKPAVQLISARDNQCLMTWMPKQLAGIPAESFSRNPPRLAWSPDGNKLAISNASGAVILRFGRVQGHSYESSSFLSNVAVVLLVSCMPGILVLIAVYYLDHDKMS